MTEPRRTTTSLALRVALAFAVASTLLVAVLGGTTYALVAHRLHARADRELQTTARGLSGPLERARTVDDLVGLDVRNSDRWQASVTVATTCTHLGRGAAGIGSNERLDPILALVAKDASIEVRDDAGQIACGGEPDNGPYDRVLSIDLRDGGMLRLSINDVEADDALHALLTALTGILLLSLLASPLVGVVVARTALAPLRGLLDSMQRAAGDPALADRAQQVVPADLANVADAFDALLERLAALGQVQRRIAVDVAHELRTPLTSARANLDVLARLPADDPERGEVLADVRSQLRALTAVVDDAVAVARARTTDVPALADVDLHQLVRHVVARACELHPGLVVTVVDTRCAADCGETGRDPARPDVDADAREFDAARLDAGMVASALATLLDNAQRHGGGSGVTVWVDVDALAVSDAGPGLPAGDSGALFAPGVRGSASAACRSPQDGAAGTLVGGGLGLATVARVAAAHGGRAWASNVVGGGAAFVLELGPQVGSQDLLGIAYEDGKERPASWELQPSATPTETTMQPARPIADDQLDALDASDIPARLMLVDRPGDAGAAPELQPARGARLAWLAGIATDVVLVAGTAASALAWGLAAMNTDSAGGHDLRTVLWSASGVSGVLFVLFAVLAVRALRHARPAAGLWSLAGMIGATGFAGASATLLALDSIDLSFASASAPTGELLSLPVLHGIGAAFGLLAAGAFAVVGRRARRGMAIGRAGGALIAGTATVIGSWCVGAGLEGGDIATTATKWTSDPSFVVLAFLVGMATGGTTAIVLGGQPRSRRRSLLVAAATAVGIAVAVGANALLGA